jgi:uncharacterized OsmC-like protein
MDAAPLGTTGMDATTLRARQGPLKARYRTDPASAQVSLRAEATLDVGALQCRVGTSVGIVPVGLHAATGGDGQAACSGDMLLQALVGCAGVTLLAVATSMRLPLRGGTVSAVGQWDARGTLAVQPEAPVGLRAVEVSFELDTDATADQMARLLELTERYCVVLQTLRRPPEIVSIGRVAGGV